MFIKSFIFFFLLFFFISAPAFATENPLERPNNKMGVHLLFPSELQQAAQLVNSSGGDWGYVVIPIQINDRNVTKWQQFMDTAKQYRLIPIIRLATEADASDTQVWRKPTPEDIIDFANFLNLLNWPTKNRYVIVFNEVNRGDEWGGAADPNEYAQLLSFAVSIFKSENQDFFIINAGLDNAAPRAGTLYMNEYDYIQQMNDAVPGIFDQIDGWASHSYPNPGFDQPPSATSTMGIGSFLHEKQLVNTFTNKNLPVFITETGWTTNTLSDQQIASYYQQAWNTVWNDPSIVTIAPFLLQAQDGPFKQFSLLNSDGSFSQQYQTLKNLPKHQGYPTVNRASVLAAATSNKDNSSAQQAQKSPLFGQFLNSILHFLHIN